MSTHCLIPARGGSKRLPRKNVADLAGRPVLAYAIDAARASRLFPHVWVSTEDAAIARVAEAAGAAVHERPAALASDTATVVQVALAFVDWLERGGDRVETLCVILPTAVLLRAEDLTGALARLASSEADVVMGVTTYSESPFQALHAVGDYLRPYFADECARRSQDLPRVCVDSGYFYMCRVPVLRETQTFYCPRLVGYPIPRHRSIDIDEPADLQMAEALLHLERRGRGQEPPA